MLNCDETAKTCFISVSISAFTQQHRMREILVFHVVCCFCCLYSFLSLRISLSALACSFSQVLSLVLDRLVFALNMTCLLVRKWGTIKSVIK